MGNRISSPFPLETRGSSGSSISTLSATTPRPGVGGFTSPRSSGTNGYSYVTPPTSPRVLYDHVSSPHESVASWMSENTSYFSAMASSFDGDVLSPGSSPLPQREFDAGMQPLSSTPRNLDLIAETSLTKKESTPPLFPFKGKQTFSASVESWSYSETTYTLTSSSTNLESRSVSRDEPAARPRTPVPIPRRGTVGPSSKPTGSLSRSVSDASNGRSIVHGSSRDKTPPPVKPRKSLHFPADQGPKSPPPKPPRPPQSPATKAPPPLPKPYASKSADNSPSAQRKAVNSERKET